MLAEMQWHHCASYTFLFQNEIHLNWCIGRNNSEAKIVNFHNCSVIIIIRNKNKNLKFSSLNISPYHP